MPKSFAYLAVPGILLFFLGAGCNIVTGPGTSTAQPSTVARLPAKQPTVVKVSPLAISPVQIVPVVEDYLSDHLVKPVAGGKVFSSFFLYAEEEREGELYYYIWAVVREYVKQGTTVKISSGKSIPLIVVLAQDSDGVYNRVLGYREARSPSEIQAIQELFPASAVQLITSSPDDHARRLDLLERETLSKARAYYSVGEPVNIAQIEKQKCTNYKFEDYADLTPFTGNPQQFTMPSFAVGNDKIRAAISTGYGTSYSFAGRFGIAHWSCGTNCMEHVIIDPAAGTIVGQPFRGDYGLDYRQESRLLIVNPYKNILKPNVKATTSYLLIKDGNFPSLSPLCTYTPPATPVSPLFIDAGTGSVRRYFSNSSDECLSLTIQCNSTERYFSDDSGCGCEASGNIQ